MANEAVIIELLGNGGDPIRYTCASGTAITKGTILQLTDPRTASASTALHNIFAGIATMDKSGTDYSTEVSAYTHGIFDLYNEKTAIAIGQDVVLSGANIVTLYTTLDGEKGEVIGKALETTAAGSTETIAVLIHL